MLNLHHFDSLESTNIKAREFPVGSVIIAGEQTGGMGRFGRKWSSAQGGIYLSLVVGTTVKDTKYLTVLASVAVQHVLAKKCNVISGIKWPNDLILKKRKLCGILTESCFSGDDAKMIIGIGINSNNILPPALKGIAISLHELGIRVDNEVVIRAIVDEFESLMSMDRGNVLEEWRRLSHTLGKRIRIISGGKEVHGYARDIDGECNLIVETSQGKKLIVEGDVFVE